MVVYNFLILGTEVLTRIQATFCPSFPYLLHQVQIPPVRTARGIIGWIDQGQDSATPWDVQILGEPAVATATTNAAGRIRPQISFQSLGDWGRCFEEKRGILRAEEVLRNGRGTQVGVSQATRFGEDFLQSQVLSEASGSHVFDVGQSHDSSLMVLKSLCLRWVQVIDASARVSVDIHKRSGILHKLHQNID